MEENKENIEDRLRPKVLVCQDCGRKFIFSVQEQKKFGFRGWKDPIRCRACQIHKKILDLAITEKIPISEQIQFVEICDQCGRRFFTKYKRKPGEKVYCEDCFRELKTFNESGEKNKRVVGGKRKTN
jgi:hypothetical protein